jgi:hypothetical protein
MHLAHVTGWGHAELMGMAVAELAYWCGEALDYWAQINTVE